MRSILWGIIFVCVTVLCCSNVFLNGGKESVQAYNNGAKNNIGRAMKYVDLPDGHYKVLAVVSGQDGTSETIPFAVVERDSYEMTKGLFFVKDMPSSMLTVNYIFGKGGWKNE